MLASLVLRSTGSEVDEVARGHARAACDLTADSEEAAQVDSDARYAAALLLLDRAIIESKRAAESAGEYEALDQAVQAAHTAAHQRSSAPWREALADARAACDDALA